MALSFFEDIESPPTAAALGKALGATHSTWLEFVRHLEAEYPPLTGEWHFSGAKWGWSMRLRQNKRVIVYLTPADGFFHAGFSLGERAVAAAAERRLPKAIVEAIDAAPRYAEGRGLRLEVRRATLLPALKTLAACKMSS